MTVDKRLTDIQDTLHDTSYLHKARAYDRDVTYLLEQLNQLEQQQTQALHDAQRLHRLMKLEEALVAAGWYWSGPVA